MLRLKLYQVKESKYEYPNKVYKVPVKAYFFNHQVGAPFLEHVGKGHDQDDNVDDHPAEHVETMEARYRKEEVCKLLRGYIRGCTRKEM